MLAIVIYPIGSWAGFHRRPMLEALARNLLGKACLLVVEPPLSPAAALRRGTWREAAKTAVRSMEQQSENVWLLRSWGSPGHDGGASMARAIRSALRRLPDVQRVAALVFRPDQLAYLGLAGEDHVIYECYDEYRLENGNQWDEGMYQREKQLLLRADVVLTTSLPLLASRSREHNSVHYTANGVDNRVFQRALSPDLQVPPEMAGLTKPIVGYIGTVFCWLDYATLDTIIPLASDWHFVFVGPVTDPPNADRLKRHPNVSFLGVRPRSALPGYVRHMDVTLCPFQVNEYLHNALPLKILEYLSAGKPVVTTPLRAIEELLDVLYPAVGPEAMMSALSTAMSQADDPALVEARVGRAAAYDWDALTKKTAEIILQACS